MVGIWFFLWYSVLMFTLEFMKDSHVYLGSLTANQWILIGIFAECIGVGYVRGGGRESIRPMTHAVHSFLEEKGKKLYGSISKRHAD
jgi:prolipoprotein diacylglyceryltransferase